MYPSLIIEYGFYPPHLGKEFLEVYKGIKDERIEAKHNGNKLKNLTLKLSINGFNIKYNTFYNLFVYIKFYLYLYKRKIK